MSLGVSNKINPLTFRNSKLKWQGDFDLFQQFVDEILNIKDEWRVPRGGCKQLKTPDITIRWYEIVWWLMVKIVTGGDKLGHPFYN